MLKQVWNFLLRFEVTEEGEDDEVALSTRVGGRRLDEDNFFMSEVRHYLNCFVPGFLMS